MIMQLIKLVITILCYIKILAISRSGSSDILYLMAIVFLMFETISMV